MHWTLMKAAVALALLAPVPALAQEVCREDKPFLYAYDRTDEGRGQHVKSARRTFRFKKSRLADDGIISFKVSGFLRVSGERASIWGESYTGFLVTVTNPDGSVTRQDEDSEMFRTEGLEAGSVIYPIEKIVTLQVDLDLWEEFDVIPFDVLMYTDAFMYYPNEAYQSEIWCGEFLSLDDPPPPPPV